MRALGSICDTTSTLYVTKRNSVFPDATPLTLTVCSAVYLAGDGIAQPSNATLFQTFQVGTLLQAISGGEINGLDGSHSQVIASRAYGL